jgi:hypothetical protein
VAASRARLSLAMKRDARETPFKVQGREEFSTVFWPLALTDSEPDSETPFTGKQHLFYGLQ